MRVQHAGNFCPVIENITKLTLYEVNRRLKAFNFSSANESNSPPEIKYKDRLKISANEMLCFTRYFGILFGDFVTETDEDTIEYDFWCLYKKLRKILDIVLAPRLSKCHSKQLSIFVSEHNVMYMRLVGPLPPKLHFLEHYARLILQFGPPVSFWTMRFESKHRELKHTFSQLAGTVNVNKSLAINAQKEIFLNARNFHNCNVTLLKKMQPTGYILSQIPAQYQARGTLQLYSSLNFRGEMYHCDGIIVLRFCDGAPEFRKILSLFPFNKTQMILVQRLRTLFFDDHYHAYRVKSVRKNSFVVSVETLASTFIFSYIHKGTEEYVVCEHVL